MENSPRRGFTLIELMIVVAIIGVLAAIAVPKFAELIRKSTEGACKGNLGAVRSALSIYYGDLEGQWPSSLQGLTPSGKYMTAVPPAKTPPHHLESAAEGRLSVITAFNDAAGWAYDDVPGSSSQGSVFVNCTHTDTKGSTWTTY